jgi:hypothetical protein
MINYEELLIDAQIEYNRVVNRINRIAFMGMPTNEREHALLDIERARLELERIALANKIKELL